MIQDLQNIVRYTFADFSNLYTIYCPGLTYSQSDAKAIMIVLKGRATGYSHTIDAD